MIVKVCGMREPDNIRDVEKLHPDMMGFICWNKSPRFVQAVPSYMPQCHKVCVFVNPTIDYALQTADSFKADYLQLHGSETPEFCHKLKQTIGLKIIKAISVSSATDIEKSKEYQSVADLLLFDTRCASVGGSGVKFDWSILESYIGTTPFLLSGGIAPDDAKSISFIKHPMFAGVDLNSRFESAPAVKDVLKLKEFITEIRYEQD